MAVSLWFPFREWGGTAVEECRGPCWVAIPPDVKRKRLGGITWYVGVIPGKG